MTMKIEISIMPDKMVTARGKKPFTGVVKCPICGEVMRLTELNSGTSNLDPYYFHYECKECETEVQVYATEKRGFSD